MSQDEQITVIATVRTWPDTWLSRNCKRCGLTTGYHPETIGELKCKNPHCDLFNKEEKVMPNEKMVNQKAWEEFRESKLLWWANRSLHLFGWAIVLHFDDDGKFVEAFPARVKFRGFDSKNEEEGFIGLTEYIKDNISELDEETKL